MQHLILSGSFDERIDVLLAIIAKGGDVSGIDVRTEATSAMLFTDDLPEDSSHDLNVPNQFIDRLEYLSHHKGQETWNVIFSLLKLWHSDGVSALKDLGHPAVDAAKHISAQLHYESHKLKAYLRLREVKTDEGVYYFGYHSCEHDVLPLVADFLKDRFRTMRWQVTTKHSSVSWDLKKLTFAPGGAQPKSADDMDDLWRTFYKSTHNPDRLNTDLFKRHIPKKYWADLPEMATLGDLLAEDGHAHSDPVDEDVHPKDLISIGRALDACRSCELYGPATQAVHGQGPSQANIMIVGEQPGDHEDLSGQPFIGPSGALLRKLASDAGIDFSSCYVTNSVKHFRFEQKGKARIHKRPGVSHIAACRKWITAEIQLVNPSLIICLGATAVRSIVGYPLKLEDYLNRIVELPDGRAALVTIHPAAILRSEPDRAEVYTASLREAFSVAAAWASKKA
jgi:probable DNA metabolism protein